MAVAYLKPSEFYDEENKRMSVLKKIAARNHVKLTSRWNTFVHARFCFFLIETPRYDIRFDF
jgi:hypothetical protein